MLEHEVPEPGDVCTDGVLGVEIAAEGWVDVAEVSGHGIDI